jgi:hypothetical protein
MTEIPHCGPGNDPARREAMIGGLRALADFLERTPEFPIASCAVADLHHFPLGTDAEQRAEVERLASLVGVSVDDNVRGFYRATRAFGPVLLAVAAVDSALIQSLRDSRD